MTLEMFPSVPTGLHLFDNDIGRDCRCHGLPKGRVTLVTGEAGQGKSTVAVKTAANLQAAGLRVGYLDMNLSCSPEWLESLGVCLHEDTFLFMQPCGDQELMKAMAFLIPLTDVVILDGLRTDPAKEWGIPLTQLKEVLLVAGVPMLVLGTHVPLAWKYHSSRVYNLKSFEAPGTITFERRKDSLGTLDGEEHTFTL